MTTGFASDYLEEFSLLVANAIHWSLLDRNASNWVRFKCFAILTTYFEDCAATTGHLGHAVVDLQCRLHFVGPPKEGNLEEC